MLKQVICEEFFKFSDNPVDEEITDSGKSPRAAWGAGRNPQ